MSGVRKNSRPIRGDLLLTRRKAVGSALIGLGQRRKFPKEYAYWTHCAIFVDPTNVAEALGTGVVVSPFAKYDLVPHTVVYTTTSSEERVRVVGFALHAVGAKYGWAEIFAQGLYLATGTNWRICRNNQLICSAMAAEALCRTDAIFPEEPLWCTPAHLAQYYGAKVDV